MSMFIILPNKRDGLPQLETRLKEIDMQDLSKNMYKSEVDVSIPKFKIEFEVSLVDALKKVMQFMDIILPAFKKIVFVRLSICSVMIL